MSVLKMGSRQNPKCHISTSARLFFLHIETLRDVHQDTKQLSMTAMIDKSAVVNNNGFIDYHY